MRAKLTVGAVSQPVLPCLLSPSPARAHHAFAAEFDEKKPVKFVDATVTKVMLINPHSWIYVDVKQPDGTVENWAIEAGSPNILLRRGITKDTLKIGDKIVVDGYQSKDGSHRGQTAGTSSCRTGNSCSSDLPAVKGLPTKCSGPA